MPGRRLYVDMSALLEAMDSRAEQPAFVFDTLTGEIALALEPAAGAAGRPARRRRRRRYRPDPARPGRARPAQPPQTLEDHDRRQEHQTRLLDQALAWLEALGIEPQFELATARRPRPLGRPGRALGQPAVGLFDLLLLGGPEPEPDADRWSAAGSAPPAASRPRRCSCASPGSCASTTASPGAATWSRPRPATRWAAPG